MTMEKNKKTWLDWLRIAAIVVFAGIFLFAGWKVYGIMKERADAQKHYQEMQESFVTPYPHDSKNDYGKESGQNSEDDGTIEIETDERRNPWGAPIWVDFEALKAVNSDVIGWLYSADTPINYPIMQADNDSFYLYRDFNKNYSTAGSLYIHSDFAGDWSDPNTVVYGHNLKGTDIMFGTLTAYMRQSYYNKHQMMWLFTEEHVYKVHLYSGYTTRFVTECYSNFRKDAKGFAQWIEWAAENSDFSAGIAPTDVTKTITFSTCTTNADKGYRYIVVGSLEEVIPVYED